MSKLRDSFKKLASKRQKRQTDRIYSKLQSITNWSQCIRVAIDAKSDDKQTLQKKINVLKLLSVEFDRPVLFIVQHPKEDKPELCLYYKGSIRNFECSLKLAVGFLTKFSRSELIEFIKSNDLWLSYAELPEIKISKQVSNAQSVFDHLCNGGKYEEIGETVEALADELGVDPKNKYVPYDKNSKKYENCYDNELTSIGKGMSAKVIKYRNCGGRVAVKMFSQLAQKQYNNEVNILYGLNHENIVQYVSTGQIFGIRGGWSIHLEYMQCDLDTFIQKTKNFPPSWNIKLRLGHNLASALEFLHVQKQIVHCDLKGQNVLLGWNEGELVAKLADYNLSRKKETAGNYNNGPPLYMAPEVLARVFNVAILPNGLTRAGNSVSSDMYSYGLVLWNIAVWAICNDNQYNTIGSKVKFAQAMILRKDSDPRFEKASDIENKNVATLVSKCWSKRREDRPSSGDAKEILGEELKISLGS